MSSFTELPLSPVTEGGDEGRNPVHFRRSGSVLTIVSEGMKRKIAAILAADVAEYSRLVAEDEEDALARLMTAQSVFQASAAKHRGRIFNTAGDAILAEFASAVDAARAAIDIQQKMGAQNQAYPASRQLHFRIGLSIGDVVEHGTDLLGDGVNIASRLQALAPLGGLAVSHWVQEQTVGKVGTTFRDIGRQTLKNIPAPVHVFVADLAPRVLSKSNPIATADSVAETKFALNRRLTMSVSAAIILVLAGIAYLSNRTPSTAPDGQTPQNATVIITPTPTVAPPATTKAAVIPPPPIAVPAPPAIIEPSPPPSAPTTIPRPATAQIPQSTAPAPAPATKDTAADRKRATRSCAEVLERAQLGDTTPEDQAFLRNQCR